MHRTFVVLGLIMALFIASVGTVAAAQEPPSEEQISVRVDLSVPGYIAEGYRKTDQPEGSVWRIQILDPEGNRVCRTNGAGERGEITGNSFLLDGQIYMEVIHHKKGNIWVSSNDQDNWCWGTEIPESAPTCTIEPDTFQSFLDTGATRNDYTILTEDGTGVTLLADVYVDQGIIVGGSQNGQTFSRFLRATDASEVVLL
jgi:hypothetical protein